MSKSKRVVAPFTNEFGTFNPGDQAIAITVSTGRVSVARVEYVGYVERKVYSWHEKKHTTRKHAQIRRPIQKWQAFYKGTDERASWPYKGEVEYRTLDGFAITTLQHNRLIPAGISTDELIKEIG